jgi:hypothetical protein
MSTDDHSTNGSEEFRQFLRDQSLSIAAHGREAGFFDHRPTSGVAREAILRKPLEEFLPARYGVATGEVRGSDGSVSGQWDILIYNKLDTPRMFSSFDAMVLPVEGIQAAISVRSNLNKAAITDVAEAAAVLRSMPRNTLPAQPNPKLVSPAVFAVGFKGIALKKLREHVLAATVGPDSPSVLTGACVLGSGLVMPVNEAGNVAPEDIQGYREANASEGAWGMFLGLLWASLIMTPQVAPNLFSHMKWAELLDPE